MNGEYRIPLGGHPDFSGDVVISKVEWGDKQVVKFAFPNGTWAVLPAYLFSEMVLRNVMGEVGL